MTTTDSAPRYKLGLIHDHRPPVVPDLSAFATAPEPTPPEEVPIPVTLSWPMACNDTEGDCTIAGATHVNQAGALITDEPWTYQGDPATHSTYRSLTGGGDTGLLLSQVLAPWHRTGLWGEKNGGYFSVHPMDLVNVRRSIWIMGNAYIGVSLPMPAQGQFKPDGSGVWELTHTSADYDIEGGHCVVPVAYTAEGVYAITWGGVVLITWQWWTTYVTQVYGVVPPAFVEKGGDGRGYDLAQIDAFEPGMAA